MYTNIVQIKCGGISVKGLSIKILAKVMIFILCGISISAFANQPKVLVNGQSVRFDQQPRMIGNILLAPIRPIADLMNAETRWNKETRVVTINYMNTGVAAGVDNTAMHIRNMTTGTQRTVSLPTPPIFDGVAFFPIEAMVRALGVRVTSDGATLHIITPKLPTTLTVTFNPNGATSGRAPDAMSVQNSGSRITLPDQGELSRTGHTFNGWNTRADGTGTNHNAGSSYGVNHNVTLYAKWVPSAPPPPSARITITNSTGYTVRKVFFNPTTSSTWGPNRLGSQILYDGHSITLDLPYSLNQENWYDIKLEDSGNNIYVRKGVNIAVNNRIGFSQAHIARIVTTSTQNPTPRPLPPHSSDFYLNTIGLSIGSSFATPLLIFTLHGTHAPVRNMYLEYGFDLGLIHGGPNNSEIYSVNGYYSIYPFANVGYFRPFEDHEGGWYIGGGDGYMFSKYTFNDGTTDVHRVALNFTTGVIIWNKVNISYTLRTNFVGANNKLSVGLLHRFD